MRVLWLFLEPTCTQVQGRGGHVHRDMAPRNKVHACGLDKHVAVIVRIRGLASSLGPLSGTILGISGRFLALFAWKTGHVASPSFLASVCGVCVA